ncbi:MAG: hypothetical protein BAA02_03735 [Paenibacillaceae bacterium ZCTH02-B3]|nr:MAG: hypothetical protein BAA02_03735 [Paenibacillaceae bacterium ZCTH02-B3]
MAGAAIFSFFFLIVLYVGLTALVLFIFYLVIREAISRSRVADHLEGIHQELRRLNDNLQSSRGGGRWEG